MDYISAVKKKYDYLTEYEAKMLVNRAKSICVEEVYKGDMSVNYLNFDFESNARFDMWILDCVDELVERAGISSVVAYKENGMSWTFDRAGISQALLDRLPVMAHTIK